MIPRWLRDYVGARLAAAAARVRTVAKTGRPVELTGHATGPTDQPYQDQAILMQQYGYRSRPLVGAELVALSLAGFSSQLIAVASEVPGLGPTDQHDGEVELYSVHGQRVQLQRDGGVRIQARGGAVCWIKGDGTIQLSTGTGGGVATLDGKRWTVQDEAAALHTHVVGPPPVASPSAAGVVPAVVRGGDGCCVLTLAVTNIIAGAVCTIVYSSPWSSAPLVSVSGGGPLPLAVSATTTTITLSCAALPVGSYTLVLTSVGAP